MTTPPPPLEPEPIHHWFGLSYANYLVLPRSLLQSMPEEWQRRFVDSLRDLQDAFAHVETALVYDVRCRGERGRFVPDPVPHYNRGRTYVEPLPAAAGGLEPR